MTDLKIGERVRVCARPDWVADPGYPLTGTEGIEIAKGSPDGFIEIYVEKTNAPINTGTRITLLENAAVRV